MVLEIVQVKIKPGREADFEAAFEKIVALYRPAKGWISAELQRSIEEPGRYFLFVEWETMEDHTETFRNSPAFVEFRALVGDLFDGPSVVGHTELVGKSG